MIIKILTGVMLAGFIVLSLAVFLGFVSATLVEKIILLGIECVIILELISSIKMMEK